jgi:hypothetical protein
MGGGPGVLIVHRLAPKLSKKDKPGNGGNCYERSNVGMACGNNEEIL